MAPFELFLGSTALVLIGVWLLSVDRIWPNSDPRTLEAKQVRVGFKLGDIERRKKHHRTRRDAYRSGTDTWAREDKQLLRLECEEDALLAEEFEIGERLKEQKR